MHIIREMAHARAGLIGNPSDGYGGKTIAFTIGQFAARVVMYPWERLEIVWSRQDNTRFDSLDELVEDVKVNGYYGGVRLIKATIKTFAEFCRREGIVLRRQPFSVRYETNIPRGVGLAGSSAIVVATLKCLVKFYAVPLEPALLASIARSVENDELGIACGYQDRVVQAHGGLVSMDFGRMRPVQGFVCGDYQRLDHSRMPLLYIAYDEAAAKISGAVHGPLRQRVADDEQLAATMQEIAGLVPQAREAIEQEDAPRLFELINRNFDLRRTLYTISEAHLALVQAARDTGASAKFAGSGGAIVGTCRDDAAYEKLVKHLSSQSKNWRVLRPLLAAG